MKVLISVTSCGVQIVAYANSCLDKYLFVQIVVQTTICTVVQICVNISMFAKSKVYRQYVSSVQGRCRLGQVVEVRAGSVGKSNIAQVKGRKVRWVLLVQPSAVCTTIWLNKLLLRQRFVCANSCLDNYLHRQQFAHDTPQTVKNLLFGSYRKEMLLF